MVLSSSLCRANLSQDYFVDRQDRYLKFKNCPQLADYFADLVEAVASHSFTLKADGNTDPPSAVPEDPLSSTRAARTFRESLGGTVKELSRPGPVLDVKRFTACGDNAEELDTAVFPLVQMGYYGITQDEVVTQKLLAEVRVKEQLYLASGYFNLPPQYIQAILQGQGKYKVLAASPEVWYGMMPTRYYFYNPLSSSNFRQMASMVAKVWLATFPTCISTLPRSFWKQCHSMAVWTEFSIWSTSERAGHSMARDCGTTFQESNCPLSLSRGPVTMVS